LFDTLRWVVEEPTKFGRSEATPAKTMF